jgi:hypothetical protein
MAEERNLGVARAAESGDTDTTKAELQRRMEEARESITQTVTEIKDTVANQYQAVRDTVTEALDWREQFRKRPVAFSIGALSAGFIMGYTVAGTFKGDSSAYEEGEDYPSYEESDAFSTAGAAPRKLSSTSYEEESRALRRAPAPSPAPRAQQATAAAAYGSTAYAQAPPVEADYGAEEEEEPKGPGLLERFKETRAYDKLQEEVSVLGDRFIEELSSVGRNVVLPALFAKVKDLFGVDLSDKKTGQARSLASSSGAGAVGTGSTGASTGTTEAASATSAGAGSGSASSSAGAGAGSGGGSSSYATSENRGYQTPSPDRA